MYIAIFKANSRNAALLEEFLRIRGSEALKAQAGGPKALQEDPKDVKPGAGSGQTSGASGTGFEAGSTSGSGEKQKKKSWFS